MGEIELQASHLQHLAELYPEVDVGQKFEEIMKRDYMKVKAREWDDGLEPEVATHYTIMILRKELGEEWGFRI